MKGVVQDKSYSFALEIVDLYKDIVSNKREYVLSKQVLRSGTAIGALIQESEFAESNADFVHKLNIALKEANETKYWLRLLNDSQYISKQQFENIFEKSNELVKLLAAIVKTLRQKQKK